MKYPDDKGEDVAKLTIEDQGPKQCVMVRELILESFALSLSLPLQAYTKKLLQLKISFKMLLWDKWN